MTDNIHSAEQPTSFVPTPDELAVLVRHWATEAIHDKYFLFWGQCYGGSDLDRVTCDWARVSEIAKTLGDDMTEKTIEQAYQQAAQDYDRNHWIVFRYGTHEEEVAYQQMGGQALEHFHEGVADRLASEVMERVFREGPVEEQMSLLKEELRRYSTKLQSLKSGPQYIIEVFGIDFPVEIKRLALSIGIEDPKPDSPNTFFKTLTLEQGKAMLAALDEVARKGEGALKELVDGPVAKE